MDRFLGIALPALAVALVVVAFFIARALPAGADLSSLHVERCRAALSLREAHSLLFVELTTQGGDRVNAFEVSRKYRDTADREIAAYCGR